MCGAFMWQTNENLDNKTDIIYIPKCNSFPDTVYCIIYLQPRVCDSANVMCIGTLIKSNWILTSAECVFCIYEEQNKTTIKEKISNYYFTIPFLINNSEIMLKFHTEDYIYPKRYKNDITCNKWSSFYFEKLKIADYFFIKDDIGLIKTYESVGLSKITMVKNTKEIYYCKSINYEGKFMPVTNLLPCEEMKNRVKDCDILIEENVCDKFIVTINDSNIYPSGSPLLCNDKLVGIYSIPHVENHTQHLWMKIDIEKINVILKNYV